MAKLEDATRTIRVVLFSAMTMGSIGLVATAYALEPDADATSRGQLRRAPRPMMSLSGLRGAVAPERGRRRREVARRA